ncbi:MAG: GTP cyclohydrolase, FolE2/MptA family [Candidatus Odinarchaeota archaeon]
MVLPDTQNTKPEAALRLTEVGIQKLKTLMTIERNGTVFKFIPVCDLFIDLPENLKGAHLSRLVEAITAVLTREAPAYHESVERMAVTVLNKVFEKHPFIRAKISLEFDFAVVSMTPKSEKQSIEVYRIKVTCVKQKEHVDPYFRVTVTSRGNTACPHGLATSNGRTHIQRAVGMLTVMGIEENVPAFEEMIDVVENSFSSRTYSILKTVDEVAVINRMYENPSFCEDVTRRILAEAQNSFVKKTGRILDIEAKTISEESIHKHNVSSRGEIKNGAVPSTIKW